MKSSEIALSNYENVKGEWKYRAVTTLRDALQGADFVVISILPGTFREMESDVHTPEKYGIFQSVGDSTGPGGLVRALRAIPMFVEIAEAIKNHSPEAWVINYTNPMTLCTRTLFEVFPQIKAFGCCHEVFGTQNLLAAALKDLRGLDGVSRTDIKTNVLGINHFTWIDKATYQGMDLFPLFREFYNKYYARGFEAPSEDDENAYFTSGQRVKMDLFRRYGIIAAAGDRHLAEFCPPWYLKDPETVKKWQFRLTPVSHRSRDLEERRKRAEKLVKGEEKLRLYPPEEEGVLQIKALLNLRDFVTNVNIRNQGQIKGLPIGCVVETNALFTHNSLIPQMAGQLPGDVNNLVLRHVINQETILKAALAKDKELAFRAFANDPLMTLSIDDAWQLFNEMLINTKIFLPGWDLNPSRLWVCFSPA